MATTTLYVNADGSGDFATIKAALDSIKTKTGDADVTYELVLNGTFNEAVTLESYNDTAWASDKNITFKKSDAEGATAVITGRVQIGYTASAGNKSNEYAWNGNVAFEGVTFDYTEATDNKNRFEILSFGKENELTITDCVFDGPGMINAGYNAGDPTNNNGDPNGDNAGNLLCTPHKAATDGYQGKLTVSGTTFNNGNINFWRNGYGWSFTDCDFNNAPVTLQGNPTKESYLFQDCNFNMDLDKVGEGIAAYLIGADENCRGVILEKSADSEIGCTMKIEGEVAEGQEVSYILSQAPNADNNNTKVDIVLKDVTVDGGVLEGSNFLTTKSPVETTDKFTNCDTVASTFGATGLEGVTAADLAGAANATVENENEDGTTEIIVTDETGDNLLVGSVNDKGQLTIDAEKSQGDDYMDIVADYFQPGEGDQYTVYVVTPDKVITGYTSFDAAEAKATPVDKLWVTGTAASAGTIMNNNDEKWGEVADSTYAGIEVDGSLTAGAAIVMHNAEFKVNAGGFVQTSDGALRIMGENASLSIEGKRPEEGSKDPTGDVLASTSLGGKVEYKKDNVSAVVNALHLSYGATGSIKNANVVINSNQGIVIGRTPADMELKEGVDYFGELTLDNSAIVMFDGGAYGGAGPIKVQVINGSSFYLKNNSVITPAVGTTGASLESALVIDEESSFFVDGTSDITVDDVDNAGKIYLHVNADENFKFYRWEGDGAVTEAEGNIFVAGATMTVGNGWENTGTLLVDLKDYDKYIAKIVDYDGDEELTYLGYGNVELMNGDYTAIVIDNDLYVTNADMTKVVVDKGWTNTTALQNDLYLNINALKTLSGALKQFVPETEEIIINVDNTEEDAPASDMTIKLEKDLAVIGKKTDKIDGDDIAWNNENGFTVNFTKVEDADAKLSFQNINLNAGPKSTILFGVDTEFDKDSSLTLWNGNVNSGATLTLNGAALNTNGTESFNVEGGAQWIINGNLSKTEEGEEPVPQTVVYYSTIFDGTATLNDTYFVAVDQLTVGDASDKENVLDGTFTANDSLVQIGGILPYNPVTNGIGELYVRTADSVVTLNNSVFKSNGNIENAGTININGSEFYTNVDDNADVTVTNSGIINISGESTVEIENYTGDGVINALNGAVITDSTIKTTVTLNGTTTWEDVTVNSLDFGYYFTPEADVTVNMSGDLNVGNFMVTLNEDNEGDEVLTLNIGKEPASEEEDNRTTLNGNQYNFGGNSVVKIVNTDFTGNYLNMTGKITIKDSIGENFGDMIVAEGAEGAETVFDNAQVSGVYAYVGGWEADDEGYGKLTLKNGSEWAASGYMIVTETSEIFLYDSALDIEGTITNYGTITMDASSSIEADSIIFRREVVKDEAGEVIDDQKGKVLNAITIDAAEFAGFNKVLDVADDITAEWEGNEYTIVNRGDVNFFLHNGDLYATTIDTTVRYIDAAWADMSLDTEYGDSVAADKVFGYNAFGNLADALVDAPEDITLNIIASDIEYVAPDADKGIPEEIHKIDAAATIDGDVTLKGEATFTGNQLTVNGALNITEEADFTFGNTVMVKGELDITDADAEFSKLSVLGNATVGADADVIVNSLTIRDDDGSFSVVDGAVVTVNNTLNVGYEANVTSQIGTLEVADATFAANKALNVTGGSSATFTNANVTLTGVTGDGDIAISDSEVTVQANNESDYYGKITLDNVTIKGAGYLDLYSANRITVESDLTVTDNANVVFGELTNNYAGEIYIKDGASLSVDGGSLASNVKVSGGASFVVTDDLNLGKDIKITLADGNLTLNWWAVLTGKKSDIWMDHLSTITFTELNADGRIAEGAITIDLTKYDNGKDGACVLFDNESGRDLTKDDYQVIVGDDYNLSSGAFYVDVVTGDLIYDLDNVTAFDYEIDEDGNLSIDNADDEFAYIDNADATYDAAVEHQGVESFIKQGTFKGTVSGGTIHDNGFTEAEVITGDTDLTVDGGDFKKIVMGGDRLNDGFIYRTGDANLTINDGTFDARIAGGSIYAGEDLKSRIIQVGDINLTIKGGNFNSDIYGGHIAKGIYGGVTLVEGDITVTIDAKAKIDAKAFIVAGSWGTGIVDGATNVVFTGDVAKGDSFLGAGNTVWGGSASDGYKVVDGERVFETTVSGSRTITFDDFAGNFGGVIRGFDTFEVLNGSDVTVAYENLSDITTWEFGADTTFAGAFGDIAGDTLIINGEIEGDWTLGGAGEIEGLFGKVEINGVEAELADGAWTTEDYKLAIEGNSLKFSALA